MPVRLSLARLFGHKPSHGIVSQRNLDYQDQLGEQGLWVVGPMGVTAGDIRDALRILAGPSADKAIAWKVELAYILCIY